MGSIQHPRAAVSKRRRRTERVRSLTPGFDPHKIHASLLDIPEEGLKQADRVGASANAGDHVVGKSSRHFDDLR